MGPLGIALIPLRKVIEQLDIAGQAHPDMGAFDQVVAQNPVFRESSRQNSAEGANIVDAFALVRAFAAEILIDIGDSLGVGIDPDGIGEKTAEGRDHSCWSGSGSPAVG